MDNVVAELTFVGIHAALEAAGFVSAQKVAESDLSAFAMHRCSINGVRSLSLYAYPNYLNPVLVKRISGDDRGMLPQPATLENMLASFAWLFAQDAQEEKPI